MSDATRVTEAEIQAYADGVLPEERRAAVEAYLAAQPEDAESVEIYRRLRENLRAVYDPVLSEPLPRRFEHVPRPPAPRPRFGLAAALLAAGVAAGVVASWQVHLWHTSPVRSADVGARMVHRAALVHATYAPEVRHPVEVGADQQAHLVAWLSKRLGMKVTAPNFDAAGMSLIGGRLLPGETRPAAWLMYETRDGRRATLYWDPDAIREGKVNLRFARDSNVAVFYWIDDECGYALASADLSHDELRRIAVMAYDQLEK
jgi:anti-sigma factor RsiW